MHMACTYNGRAGSVGYKGEQVDNLPPPTAMVCGFFFLVAWIGVPILEMDNNVSHNNDTYSLTSHHSV